MIEIKVDDKEVISLLNKLAKKTEDMTPAMRVIAGIMHDAVEENFEKEGQPRWIPPRSGSGERKTSGRGHKVTIPARPFL